MKSSLKSLGSVLASLGLFTISLSFSPPVEAGLPCEYGTVSSHPNGSVASCNIENNLYITIGSFAFSCLQGHSISFDEKGQFNSCIVSVPVHIRTGNAVKTCPKESMVSASILNDGSQSINCNCL